MKDAGKGAANYLSDPGNLANIGQIVGGVTIALACTTPTPAVVACAVGLTIYIYASAFEVAAADSTCERIVAGGTSAVGLFTGGLGKVLAGLSGAADAVACPSPVYASGPSYQNYYQNKE